MCKNHFYVTGNDHFRITVKYRIQHHYNDEEEPRKITRSSNVQTELFEFDEFEFEWARKGV